MASQKCQPSVSFISKLLFLVALLLIPAFTLLIYILVTSTLESATCQITRVQGDGIQVQVRPDNSEPPFSTFITSSTNDAGRPLVQGQRLPCYYAFEDGQTTLNFSSNRNIKRIIGIVLISIWLGLTVAGYLYFFWRHGCDLSHIKLCSSFCNGSSDDTRTSDAV